MGKETSQRETGAEQAISNIVQNRKARHDYEILDSYEAGIVLVGTEVKSLRAGKVNLKDSYASIEKGEVILRSVHISPYEPGNRFNHEPERPRKLLLHRAEIRRLIGRSQRRGLTLVPLRLYFRGGRAKVELALARGKKQYDKRETIAKKDLQRDMERALKDTGRQRIR